MVNPRCRLGWLPFNGSCYKSFPDKLSWNDALTFCRGIKGDLASIADKTENDFIQSYLGSGITTFHIPFRNFQNYAFLIDVYKYGYGTYSTRLRKKKFDLKYFIHII